MSGKSFAVIGLGQFGMTLAKELANADYDVLAIDDKDENIQEIAIRTNFANQSSLGRFFRKHTGMSLSQYRMSHLD